MGKRKHQEEEKEESDEQREQSEPELSDELETGDEDEDDSSSGSSGSEPDVSDEDEDDSDDADGEAFEEVQVDFQFYDPADKDYHGLKALLATYLDGRPYEASALVDTLVAQANQVGTVVKTGEDDDPIAIMTVLNTQRHAEAPFMPQILEYITSKCSDAAVKQQLQQAWSAPGTGLLLNERLVNSPPQIAPPLVQALFEEIDQAAGDTADKESKWYTFKRFILLTRVYSDPAAAAGGGGDTAAAGPSSSRPPAGPSAPQKKKKQKGEGSKAPGAAAGGPLLVYVRPEDEFFAAQAAAVATWPVEGRPVGRDELQPLRCVMLLEAGKVAAARAALDAVIGNSYSAWQPDA